MVSVLFVCMANICRSPAAEAVFKRLAAEDGSAGSIHIESCGIGSWSLGQLPDERMRDAAAERGLVLAGRAQQFRLGDYDAFDYILAVDKEVFNHLLQNAPKAAHKAKIYLITDFSSGFRGQNIPDPYYQGDGAFDNVLDVLEDCCFGLLEHIKGKS